MGYIMHACTKSPPHLVFLPGCLAVYIPGWLSGCLAVCLSSWLSVYLYIFSLYSNAFLLKFHTYIRSCQLVFFRLLVEFFSSQILSIYLFMLTSFFFSNAFISSQVSFYLFISISPFLSFII